MTVTLVHAAKRHKGTAAERSVMSEKDLATGDWFFETDTENAFAWTGTEWKQVDVDPLTEDLTLDDGTGDSPTLEFVGASDEFATLHFDDTARSLVITLEDDKAEALRIIDEGGTDDYLTVVTTDAQRELVINQDGADIDTRIEAVGQANALFVRGSDGFIGAGTTVLTAHLTVLDDVNGLNPSAKFTNVSVGNAARTDMYLEANNADALQLVQFGSNHATLANQGWITTSGATNLLVFGTVGGERARIDTLGNFGIGITPTERLHVNGAILTSGAVAGVNVASRTGAGTNFVFYNPAGTELKIWGSGGEGDMFWFTNAGRFGVLAAPLAQVHIDQPSATGAQPVLLLDQGDVSEQHLVCTMGGADVDFPAIIELTVTGTPTLWWDESLDTFAFTKGLLLAGDLILPKTSGNGIKVDTTTPTFSWRDMFGDVFARNTGSTKPDFVTYRDTLLDYQFAAGDEEYFKFHIRHDYVAGTDIHIHAHWSHTGTFVTGGTVTFDFEASYAKAHNQAAFPASVTGSVTGTASTTQYQHILSEKQLSAAAPDGEQLDSDDLEPDGVIIVRVGVQANDITVSEGAVPDPFIHYVDIHYQSTGIGTKDKVPDFYD